MANTAIVSRDLVKQRDSRELKRPPRQPRVVGTSNRRHGGKLAQLVLGRRMKLARTGPCGNGLRTTPPRRRWLGLTQPLDHAGARTHGREPNDRDASIVRGKTNSQRDSEVTLDAARNTQREQRVVLALQGLDTNDVRVLGTPVEELDSPAVMLGETVAEVRLDGGSTVNENDLRSPVVAVGQLRRQAEQHHHRLEVAGVVGSEEVGYTGDVLDFTGLEPIDTWRYRGCLTRSVGAWGWRPGDRVGRSGLIVDHGRPYGHAGNERDDGHGCGHNSCARVSCGAAASDPCPRGIALA